MKFVCMYIFNVMFFLLCLAVCISASGLMSCIYYFAASFILFILIDDFDKLKSSIKTLFKIVPVILMTIYMTDGSYVWVDKLDEWKTCGHHGYSDCRGDVCGRKIQSLGVKYTLANVTHYVPYSSIREITSE